MPLTDVQKDRLAALNAEAEADEALEADAEQGRRLEELELVASLKTETGGKRGVAFEVVNNPHGVFGLKKPDTQACRNWEKASEEKRQSLEWQISILRHYILPVDRQTLWCQTAGERPGLSWQTASAFVDLMGIDRKLTQKK